MSPRKTEDALHHHLRRYFEKVSQANARRLLAPIQPDRYEKAQEVQGQEVPMCTAHDPIG